LKPEPGKAAVEVLESMGYEVIVPDRPLYCGRPLYDFGMLSTAKKLLRQILDKLKPLLAEGIAVVALEPSCVATFPDELINFFPQEPDAQRLSQQTFMLSEFLERQNFMPPPLHRKALVHGHCHHKAIMHMDAEVAVLKKMELDYELIDSGCCGMAGSFGFEREKYDVSVQVGERVLLPKIRQADKDTLIITNGFSCQQQIEQLTGRESLHLAEVLRMAIQQHGASDRDASYSGSG
jgi:Fe-S oxidoreductase